MKITDWSITPDQNTSVDGLSIAPGAAARNVGGALRAIMAGVKAAADESGEVEQFFSDHPSYQVNGAGAYLSAIAPSDGAWGTYLSALAADYASADRGALRIPYSAGRMCHVLASMAGTEVTVYIPSQRLIRMYSYSTGEWTETGAESLSDALTRLTSLEASAVTITGAQTITGAKTFTSAIVGDLSGTAAKATADSDGAVIAVTYLKKADLEDIYVRTTVTLSDALKAGTPVEVPEHTVGGNGMAVYLCGVLCARGAEAQYLDVDSTHISFNDDLETGMDIAVVVSFK